MTRNGGGQRSRERSGRHLQAQLSREGPSAVSLRATSPHALKHKNSLRPHFALGCNSQNPEKMLGSIFRAEGHWLAINLITTTGMSCEAFLAAKHCRSGPKKHMKRTLRSRNNDSLQAKPHSSPAQNVTLML